jgi:hypothetical protein
MTEYQALLNAGATHSEAIEQLRIVNQSTGLNMAATKTASHAKTDKSVKAETFPPTLVDRVKTQLDTATLRKKITLDDLSDLEQHIRRLAVFLGAPA